MRTHAASFTNSNMSSFLVLSVPLSSPLCFDSAPPAIMICGKHRMRRTSGACYHKKIIRGYSRTFIISSIPCMLHHS